MNEDRWLTEDVPMLEAIAELEEVATLHRWLADLVRATGFEETTVKESLRRLEADEYVTFKTMTGAGNDILDVFNVRLLRRGRRAVGQLRTEAESP